MSIGKYKQMKPREEFVQHRIIQRQDKKIRDLEKLVISLQNKIDKYHKGRVMISHNFEQLRVLMEQVG